MPKPEDDLTFGTLGGAGYGRFPLGTAGPEFIYDDDGNPIMEPKFGRGLRDNFMSIGGPGGGFDYDSITAIGAGGGPELRNMNQNSFLDMDVLRNAAGNPADAFRTPPSVGDGMTITRLNAYKTRYVT